MRYFSSNAIPADLGEVRWLLVYATVDVDLEGIVGRLRGRFRGVPIFGCTSFQGVFTPEGFLKGAWVLAGDASDDVSAFGALSVWNHDPAACAREVAERLKAKAGERGVGLLIAHPTPGAEEAMLRGVAEVFPGVPVYGGSAADNDVSGQWKIFCDDQQSNRGMVLIGLRSEHAILADFLSGYLPTRHKGVVTGVRGRNVLTIDGRPASEVYNEWTLGAIGGALKARGGVVLAETTLAPVARVKARVGGIAFHLLSHPCEVLGDNNALSFFTDFEVGDEITLMRGNPAALVTRVEQVAKRALGNARPPLTQLSGSILVYCAGCVGAVRDQLDEIAERFRHATFQAPFLGVATFGEQGRALGTQENWHGNLMCSAVLMA